MKIKKIKYNNVYYYGTTLINFGYTDIESRKSEKAFMFSGICEKSYLENNNVSKIEEIFIEEHLSNIFLDDKEKLVGNFQFKKMK